MTTTTRQYRRGEDEPNGQNRCLGCGCRLTSGNVCSPQCSRKVAGEADYRGKT